MGADLFIFLLLRSPLRKPAPVFPHTLGKQLSAGGRRVGDGIGPSLDGGPDGVIRRPTGSDDGNLRELLPDMGHDLRRPGRPGYVEEIHPAASFPATSVCSDTTVYTSGISTVSLMARMASSVMKVLHTSPKAP